MWVGRPHRLRTNSFSVTSSCVCLGLLLSLHVDTELFPLEVGRDALRDLLSSVRVVNLEREEVLVRAQLELGERRLLVLLDSDLFRLGKVLTLMTHDLNEFLQFFDFLGLPNTQNQRKTQPLTIFLEP